MNELVDSIFNSLLKIIHEPRIVAAILAILPMAEARLAIPVAIKYNIPPLEAFLYGFIPSTLTAALLLLCLLPFINFLAKTRAFKKIGESLISRFSSKTEKIQGAGLKRMMSIALFVSLPLPLTGVWTGSATAAILGLKYKHAILSITAGNLVCSALVTVASVYFSEYINIIVTVFTVVALAAAVIMLIKVLFPSKSKPFKESP